MTRYEPTITAEPEHTRPHSPESWCNGCRGWRETLDAYLYGDCTRLADALAALTGGTVVYIAPAGQLDYGHAMVQLADGRMLDIRGIHTADVDPRLHFPIGAHGLYRMPDFDDVAAGKVPDVEVTPATAAHHKAWQLADDPAADDDAAWVARQVVRRLEIA